MAAFSWRALDSAGKLRKGVMEGDSARQVRNKLRAESCVPTEVTPVVVAAAKKTRTAFNRPVKPRDLALFSTQLAVLLNSGLPLEQALDNVVAQTKKKPVANLLKSVRARVSEGHTLANAMAAFPGSFPDYYVPTIAAGEHSGHLVEVMERLAEYAESSFQSRQKLQMALLYPVIVTLVAFLVIVVLLVYVVPQVVQVFESMQQTLPALTTGLIAVSEFLQQQGLLLILIGAISLLGYRYALRISRIRRAAHALLLRIPALGGFVRRVTAARFARTCGMLLNSQVPATESLAISAHVVSLLPIRSALNAAEERVKEGMSLQRALQMTGFFEPLMLNLIASGEASGNLGEMMVHSAQVQEKDNNVVVETMLGVFEPLMILVMGSIVLTIVLAILLPIFNMNQLIQ
ncbi:MAG: type II secretion system F family protein [Pseudomonadota bacterium]